MCALKEAPCNESRNAMELKAIFSVCCRVPRARVRLHGHTATCKQEAIPCQRPPLMPI